MDKMTLLIHNKNIPCLFISNDMRNAWVYIAFKKRCACMMRKKLVIRIRKQILRDFSAGAAEERGEIPLR